MYEIRSINLWILQLENILKTGSNKPIESFISTTPIRVTKNFSNSITKLNIWNFIDVENKFKFFEKALT